jgi:hypothetical protein
LLVIKRSNIKAVSQCFYNVDSWVYCQISQFG